jgi:curved DNA-binding protein CbpA
MTDHFARLEVPRRPWLDEEALKTKFMALSGEFHPDRAAEDDKQTGLAQHRYTEINAAYVCLRDPRKRLTHLIELERGAPPSELQNVPDHLMDVFFDVSKLCRSIDQFLTEKASAVSPLLKVQLFERSQTMVDEIGALQGNLNAARAQLIHSLKEIDGDWDRFDSQARGAALARLEEIRRLLGFYDRWIAQLQERFVQLAMQA